MSRIRRRCTSLVVAFGTTVLLLQARIAVHAASPRRHPPSPPPLQNALQDSLPTTVAATDTDASVSPVTRRRRVLQVLHRGATFPFPFLSNAKQQPQPENGHSLDVSLQKSILAIGAYLLLGVLSYHYGVAAALEMRLPDGSLHKPWSIVDALYFSVVSFTTVGYGDLVPTTTLGKVFTVLYGLAGIAILGTAIATIGSRLVATEQQWIEKARNVTRQQLLGFWNHNHEEERASSVCADLPSSPLWKQDLHSLVKTSIPAVTLLMLGGVVMGRIEEWSLVDSVYYSFITAVTLGYGDIAPVSKRGRLWAIVFVPLSVAAIGEVLGSVASTLMERRQTVWYQNLLKQDLNMDRLLEMDTNRNGRVSREEYVAFMLKEMDLVSEDILIELHRQFEKLDSDKGGFLDKKDLELLIAKRSKVKMEASSNSKM